MTRRSLGGFCVLSLIAASAAMVVAGCEDTSEPESAPQPVPPLGPPREAGAPIKDGAIEGGDAACVPGLPGSGLQTIAQGATNGNHATLVLDDKGAPVVAHAQVNVAGTTIIQVYRWDTVCGGFGAPLTVDTIGSQSTTGRQIALAFDRATGAVGIAYQAIVASDLHMEIRFALLAKGAAAFAAPERVDDPALPAGLDHAVDNPGLAMLSGKAFIAFREPFRVCTTTNCDGIVYRERDVSGAFGAEVSLSDPTASGASTYGSALASSTQVALDANGRPAIAWQAFDTATLADDSRGTVLFTHPTDAAPTVVTQAADGAITTKPDVALAFDGLKPRVAVVFAADQASVGTGQQEYFIASDNSVSWNAPVPMPSDHNASADTYVSLAIGTAGKLAVISASGSDDGASMFGQPKIIASNDVTNFTLGGVPKATFSQLANWAKGAYGPDGKLGLVMMGPNQATASQVGLLYFHE